MDLSYSRCLSLLILGAESENFELAPPYFQKVGMLCKL